MASAVDYSSGKPSSTNSKINTDSIRRRAKSGKGGKSGGSSGDDWHHGGDIDYTGRFSGRNKATSAQVTNLDELIDQIIQNTGLDTLVVDTTTTADIHWKFDEGFTEMMYKVSISPTKPGSIKVDSYLACASAGSSQDEPLVIFTNEIPLDAQHDSEVVTQGKLEWEDDTGTCDGDLPCMFDQECEGVMINN